MKIHSVPKILLKLHKNRAEIDLNPEYQRGKVWSKDKKQLLMDTILKDMHIPPIYFRVLDNGYYECVDGQQRLTAIFDFFEGEYPLSKKYSGEKGGLYFNDLIKIKVNSRTLRDKFEDYELLVFEIINTSDSEIREMFKRLQKGMPLTAGEKLKAEAGAIHDFILGLTKSKFFQEIINVRDYRGAYYQMCSQILALEMFGIKDVKFKILEEMHTNYGDLDSNSNEVQQVKKVINFLSRTFNDKTPELHTRAGIISLYLLTSKTMKEYSLKDKEDLIKDFVIDFQDKLREAQEKENNPELSKFLNAVSHSSDGANSIKTRHGILMKYFLLFAKDLEPLDVNRDFNELERIAIFRKNNGICQDCKEKVEYDDFHADHIVPHIRGGKTTLENGQVLCDKCNLSKGAKEDL